MGREKGAAIKQILDSLEECPATPKQLEDKLGIAHSTVMHVLRESIVAKIGIFKQLNDGKYAVKWYSEEEHEIHNIYYLLNKKLLRPPTPEELAGEIKRRPDEARDLLFKYIPGYHEPTEHEIDSSIKALWETLVSYGLDLPSKKEWFEKGIVKVIVKGVDQATLNEHLTSRASTDCNKSSCDLEEFQDMKPVISINQEGREIMYCVEWSDETKKVLHTIDLWQQTAEICLPHRYDEDKGIDGMNPWEALTILEELAQIYVPSPRIIEGLLRLVGLPHAKNDVLRTLKKFCQNALEVDALDAKSKEKIASKLIDAAFVDIGKIGRHNEKAGEDVKERDHAFEIIKMMNIRNSIVIDAAKRFVLNAVSPIPSETQGPDVRRVAKWLAEDPVIRSELIDKINENVRDHSIDTSVDLCVELLRQIT